MGGTIPMNLQSNGIMLSGSGEFNLQSDSSNFIRQTNGTFSIQSQNNVSGSSVTVLKLLIYKVPRYRVWMVVLLIGSSLPTNLSSNGIFISGSGEFNFQQDSNNLLKQSGGTFQIKSQNLW